MIGAIQKRWYTCSLQQTLNPPFQMVAIDMNMKTPLFEEGKKLDLDINEKDEDVDIDQCLASIIDDSLTIDKIS